MGCVDLSVLFVSTMVFVLLLVLLLVMVLLLVLVLRECVFVCGVFEENVFVWVEERELLEVDNDEVEEEETVEGMG